MKPLLLMLVARVSMEAGAVLSVVLLLVVALLALLMVVAFVMLLALHSLGLSLILVVSVAAMRHEISWPLARPWVVEGPCR